MAKQLQTPLRLIAHINFSLKNYSCELLNLTGTVGKVELISTFKPGLHTSCKDRKHIVTNTFLGAFQVYLDIHIVVMMAGIRISQEIFAIGELTALEPTLSLVSIYSKLHDHDTKNKPIM